jgi:hypothetical protein
MFQMLFYTDFSQPVTLIGTTTAHRDMAPCSNVRDGRALIEKLRTEGTLEYLQPFGPVSFCLPVRLSKDTKIKICSNIILPVLVYGCETWSLTLKEEQASGIEA